MSGILWIIIVGFVAGILARRLSPGPNNPSGFILTTVLGIVGAFLATFDRPGDRPLRPRPGRRLHHRDHRRAGGAVHLEQAGGQRGDSRYERSRQLIRRHARACRGIHASLKRSDVVEPASGGARRRCSNAALTQSDARRRPSGRLRRSCCWIAAWRGNTPEPRRLPRLRRASAALWRSRNRAPWPRPRRRGPW